MSEKRLDNAEEKLDCKKKYSYEYSMFWECNDGCKCQILEDDVADLLNEKEVRIKTLENENKRLAKNLKVQKDNVDANFRSAQYWRQKFEAIPENIRMVWTE